jgi:broad specificity phosphatase PhoE
LESARSLHRPIGRAAERNRPAAGERIGAALLAGEQVPPDFVYASDLARARETAEIIAARFGLPVHTDGRLREVNQGEWEGMYFPDIVARYAEEFAEREADPLNVAPPGGETVGQVQARVLAAVRDLAVRHPAQRVALVAHGMVLALIRLEAYGYPIEQVWQLVPPNAQVEEVDVSALITTNSNR